MRTVVYDLAKDLVTWDFVTWAVNVRDLGYHKVNFQVKNIPAWGRKWLEPKEILGRVDNFMLPVIRTLGIFYGFDPIGDRNMGSSHYYHMRPNFQRMEIKAEWHGRDTITIREVPYKARRNSDRGVWLAFADTINAIVIEEHSLKPITFDERFKLYAGARMNWGVTNGPLSAVFLTPYPVAMFCADDKDRKGFSGHHIVPGGQIQFSLPNQNLIWGEITYDALMRHYELQLADWDTSVGREACRCALAGDFARDWYVTHPNDKPIPLPDFHGPARTNSQLVHAMVAARGRSV